MPNFMLVSPNARFFTNLPSYDWPSDYWFTAQQVSLLSNDSVYARIGTVDSGENRIGKSFKMAEGDDRREVNR